MKNPKPIKKTVKNDPVFSPAARLWHSAFIGKTGSGKTYAARGEVEDILDQGSQVIIIDPTGAWPGIRCTPNGKPSKYKIPIFGGAHGDKPLTPDMAPNLGRLAGTTDTSMILDLSGISLELEDQREIVYQFLRNLYRTNRKPIHLIIDEADEFAPQELDKETKPLRTLVARIMARGRSLGFRCTLITQRPAKIDKNSISQIESMAVLRVTAPQDRKAVVDWFSDKGGSDRKEILDGLGSLKTGEGWVFTGLDGTYQHRNFRLIRTYDTSSTPVDDEGHAKAIDTGEIDFTQIDKAITYPEETDEIELEIALAKRRNLEEENKALRARLLKSDSRYEMMRRVFVQMRSAVDSAFVDDGLEAVEYADLALLRNEVAKDVEYKINMHDNEGVPDEAPLKSLNLNIDANINTDIKTDKTKEQEKESEPEYERIASRELSVKEKSIIIEASRKFVSAKTLSEKTSGTLKSTEKAIERLIQEKSLIKNKEGYKSTPVAFARQITRPQIEALIKIVEQEDRFLIGISLGTVKALQRQNLIDKNKEPTEKAKSVVPYLRTMRPYWF